MFNEIIINVHPYEKRIALLENHQLVELFAEKKEQQLVVGNIYKGIVKNVLPGMGAAFIDIGLSRTAFLHYNDIEPKFLFASKQIKLESDSSKIRKILSPGQEIVVQIKKDPIGKKGARVTGKLSIPGKFLVFIPKNNKIAISRKITSASERNRIRDILKKIKPDNVGVIVRTDTEGISEDDFKSEFNALHKTWRLIEKQMSYAKPPACLFDENDLSFTLVRDLFSSSIDRLVVDDKRLRNQIVSKIKEIMPELVDRIEYYNEDSPIFDACGIEKEIAGIFNSRIGLPSGGNITIQQTEALVAIDVNTGSFTGNSNYEATIKQANIEAAREAARQIRLRDLSGIMVIDFIDMAYEENRDEVFNVLKQSLKRDRAKNKVFPFSPLGLIEISRKRTRPSLLLTFSEQCPYCGGTGRLLARDSVAVQISRWLQRTYFFIQGTPLKIVVHQNVKKFFDENPRILDEFNSEINIVYSDQLETDEFKVYSLKTNEELSVKYKA